jgi:hypothetical protein
MAHGRASDGELEDDRGVSFRVLRSLELTLTYLGKSDV